MNSYSLADAERTLREGNKLALYEGILEACAGMRKKLDLLKSGKLKQAISVFRDPNNSKKYLRITQTVVDGTLRTHYWMDDSKIWEYCRQRREWEADTLRHAATSGTEHMFREYFLSSWMLETYILMKYAIDLRSSEWADPTGPDFMKVNWIMDNDEFAKRYKLTNRRESVGVSNPFNTIKVEMNGLDLSHLVSNNKDNNNEHKSSITEPQTTTNT